VQLDGTLRDAQRVCDLLVQAAGDDQIEHRTLARAQAREQRADAQRLVADLALRCLRCKRGLDRLEQGCGLYRLGQEIDRTGFHRPHAARNICVATQENDRQ
jgi:hypothetical protein